MHWIINIQRINILASGFLLAVSRDTLPGINQSSES